MSRILLAPLAKLAMFAKSSGQKLPVSEAQLPCPHDRSKNVNKQLEYLCREKVCCPGYYEAKVETHSLCPCECPSARGHKILSLTTSNSGLRDELNK